MGDLPDDPNRFRLDEDTGTYRRETPLDRKRDYVSGMASTVANTVPIEEAQGIVNFINRTPESTNVEDRRQLDPSMGDYTLDGKTIRGPRSGSKPVPFAGEEEDISKLPRFTVTPKPPLEGTEAPIKGYETWPEKLVNTLIDAFKLPGDVYQGKADPMSDKSIGRAAELAGALIFGPAPVAAKVVDGTLGSIGGIVARNAPKQDLALAQEMAKAGMNTEQIWQATKWYKGPDQRWRWEIPSQDAKFTGKYTSDVSDITKNVKSGLDSEGNLFKEGDLLRVGHLGDFFNFPELYKAYPKLKHITLQLDPELKALGSHMAIDTGNHIIALNPILIANSSKHTEKGVLLHEIQHAIQQLEGFDRGSSPARIAEHIRQTIAEKYNALRGVPNSEPMQNELSKLINDIRTFDTKTGYTPEKFYQHLYNRNPGEREANLASLRDKLPKELAAEISPPATAVVAEDMKLLTGPEFRFPK